MVWRRAQPAVDWCRRAVLEDCGGRGVVYRWLLASLWRVEAAELRLLPVLLLMMMMKVLRQMKLLLQQLLRLLLSLLLLLAELLQFTFVLLVKAAELVVELRRCLRSLTAAVPLPRLR